MELIINGEKENHSVDNILDLVETKELEKSGLVVEHNKQVIKAENWNQKDLQEGDKIELISFVGGG